MGLCSVSVVVVVQVSAKYGSAANCELPRVDGQTLTGETFNREWRSRPVVLRGLLYNWPAWRDWGDGGFERRYGALNVSRDNVNKRVLGPGKEDNFTRSATTVADVLAARVGLRGQQLPVARTEALSGSGGPIAEGIWLVQPPHALSRSVAGDYHVPTVLRAVRQTGPFVSIGQVGQGGQFNSHPENWLAQVRGRKRWMLFPPGVKLPSYTRHGHPCDFPNFHRNSTNGGFMNAAVDINMQDLQMLQCVIHEGEILYLGDHWHHATCNVEGNGTLNIAIGFIGKLDHLPVALQASADGHIPWLDSLGSDDLSATDAEGKGAMAWAATAGHVGVLQELAERGMNPCASDGQSAQPAHWAAAYGHLEAVDWLLTSRCPEALVVSDVSGQSALCWAARYGHHAVVDRLLKLRAPLDAVDKKGATAVHWAARYGHDSVILKLLAKRASPVTAAAQDLTQPLHWAAKYGESLVADVLLNHKVAISAQASDGSRPLHLAARYGQVAILARLARAGMLEAPDRNGVRPLGWAARFGHDAVVKRLLHLRANVVATGGGAGAQAIHWASQEGHAAVINALINADSRTAAATDQRGMQPLHWAVSAGHAAVVGVLLQRGADASATTLTGGRAIDFASGKSAGESRNRMLTLLRGAQTSTIHSGTRHAHAQADATGARRRKSRRKREKTAVAFEL